MAKIKVSRIDSPKKIRSYLNEELAGTLDKGKICLSGWACDPKGEVPEVVIRNSGAEFRTDLTLKRQDVEEHLRASGISSIQQPLGYRFDFSLDLGLEVGFRASGQTEWHYRVSHSNMVEFKKFDSVSELINDEEGVCENVYFRNGDDWSKVVIFFNGALTPDKVESEKAVFQRWSWARHFRHPVLSIADPLTIGKDPIVLGWYLGAEGPNALPEILEPVRNALLEKAREAKIVGFGSSGGGFAALGGVLIGLIDEAIVINPQVDALEFEVKSAVAAFMKKRDYKACDFDLKNYNFNEMQPNAKVLYLQNRYDAHHFNAHYLPFKEKCESSEQSRKFTFLEYEDQDAGHIPPSMNQLKEIIGKPFEELLVS